MPEIKDGEWIRPDRKGWVHECCGCGLQHKVSFKLINWFKNKIIYMKWEQLTKRNL